MPAHQLSERGLVVLGFKDGEQDVVGNGLESTHLPGEGQVTQEESKQASSHNSRTVIADAEPTQSLQPTDGSFHYPADLPQPAAMRRLPPGDVRLDAQP